MFGTYRAFLAICVVCTHIGSIPALGGYAVHGFFILSGYLMTYIMSNSYGYNRKGMKAFAINRWLRLYPAYYAMLILSVVIILYWGDSLTKSFTQFMFLPTSFAEWFQNLTLVYWNLFPNEVLPRIAPPTWALTNELFFYFLIGIGISKSKKLTIAWFCCSVLYMGTTHILGLEHTFRYHMILAASLPFSIGALIYHFNTEITKHTKNLHSNIFLILIAAFVLNSFLAGVITHLNYSNIYYYISYYSNYLINTFLIIFLLNNSPPYVSKKFDQELGNYSYPIYLFHWQAGFISSMLIWGEPIHGLSPKGFITLISACIVSIMASYLIIQFVDKPIQKLRFKIKKKADSSIQ